MKKYPGSGFTLVEFMVVIAIIGLLSSVILTTLNRGRVKARDVKRVTDVQAIVTALQLFYSEHRRFPCHEVDSSYSSANFLGILEDEGLISEVPIDPINTYAGLLYYYYLSYHSPDNDACGQYAVVGFNTELPIPNCPFGGYKVPDFTETTHCHIFMPRPPSFCILKEDTECEERDRAAVNEY
jgi:type IV pilus assembly protein PilA